MAKTLADLGERRIIEDIRKIYKQTWPDEDCFYFKSGNRYTLLTTDIISKKTHIPDNASPEAAGRYIASSNLSDIAAMGGIPKYFMTAFAMPREMPEAYLKRMSRGISDCLKEHGTIMAGGDMKEGTMVAAGFAMGEVEMNRIMLRKGAKIGDAVCVTGELGKNAAAYEMLKHDKQRKWADLVLDIQPKIKEGRMISQNNASSCMDLSDGIYSTIRQMQRINGTGFGIDLESVPLHPLVEKVAEKYGKSIEDLAFGFGGEYELFFTVKQEKYESLKLKMERKNMRITRIGRVVSGNSYLLRQNEKIRITKTGYEHFRRIL